MLSDEYRVPATPNVVRRFLTAATSVVLLAIGIMLASGGRSELPPHRAPTIIIDAPLERVWALHSRPQ